MQIRVIEQLTIGGWLGTAAAFAIMSRSAEIAVSILTVGALVAVPMFATRGLDTPRTPMQWLSMTILGAVAIVMVAASLFTIERAYLVNGKSYPRWLASGELGPVDDAALERLRTTECADEPIDVFQKDGFVVVRCGFMWYEPSTRTYIADSYTFGRNKS